MAVIASNTVVLPASGTGPGIRPFPSSSFFSRGPKVLPAHSHLIRPVLSSNHITPLVPLTDGPVRFHCPLLRLCGTRLRLLKLIRFLAASPQINIFLKADIRKMCKNIQLVTFKLVTSCSCTRNEYTVSSSALTFVCACVYICMLLLLSSSL